MSLVGVVTAVTSAIVGAVVSVVVVEEESLPELPPQPIIRINDNNRIENEKKNEKLSFPTLLGIKINLLIFASFS